MGLVVGCGLISSDVAEIKFNLPARMYSFDSSSFGVPAGISGEVPCGAGQIVTDCCNPPPPLPAPDCSVNALTCEQNENGMDVCMAQANVSQSQTMNLGQDVQQLSGLTGLVSISIKRISYDVTVNTLDVNVPDVVLYLESRKFDELEIKYPERMPALVVEVFSPNDRVFKMVARANAFIGGVDQRHSRTTPFRTTGRSPAHCRYWPWSP
jgi:hypothetical protein